MSFPSVLPVRIIIAAVAAGIVAKDKGVRSKLEQPDGREIETCRKDVLLLFSVGRIPRILCFIPTPSAFVVQSPAISSVIPHLDNSAEG